MRRRATAALATVLSAAAVSAVLVPVADAPPAAAATHTLYTSHDVAVATAAYNRMTPQQRLGQLFMVGVPVTGLTSAERSLLVQYAVGNVVLMGATTAGSAAVRTVTGAARSAATARPSPYVVAPWVSVDQEGGEVQHLKGSGFSTMPTALAQGRLSYPTLTADWKTWAGQLRTAGVNLDLAPVADTVPASVGTRNQPIGRYYREYGYTPSAVGADVASVVAGIAEGGIASCAKHFPGLGRATGNTDTTYGVTDPTTRHDAYLAPYSRAIANSVPFVMVSTAVYPSIDPSHMGAFSRTVVTAMLRGDLGFAGVVVSDSLEAASTEKLGYGARADDFVGAGGDVLLITDTRPLAQMVAALQRLQASSSSFAATVRAAVMQVLESKAHAGLITG